MVIYYLFIHFNERSLIMRSSELPPLNLIKFEHYIQILDYFVPNISENIDKHRGNWKKPKYMQSINYLEVEMEDSLLEGSETVHNNFSAVRALFHAMNDVENIIHGCNEYIRVYRSDTVQNAIRSNKDRFMAKVFQQAEVIYNDARVRAPAEACIHQMKIDCEKYLTDLKNVIEEELKHNDIKKDGLFDENNVLNNDKFSALMKSKQTFFKRDKDFEAAVGKLKEAVENYQDATDLENILKDKKVDSLIRIKNCKAKCDSLTKTRKFDKTAEEFFRRLAYYMTRLFSKRISLGLLTNTQKIKDDAEQVKKLDKSIRKLEHK